MSAFNIFVTSADAEKCTSQKLFGLIHIIVIRVLSSEPFFFFRIFKVIDDFPIAVTYFYHRTIVANKTWISDMSMNLSNLK